ncbi:MAG: hypothetical protein Q9223_002420 [Gallowayella weberi]
MTGFHKMLLDVQALRPLQETVPASTIKPTQVKNTEVASPSVATPTPTADCDFWDEVLFWHFEFHKVYNINGWAGDGGASLKKQEGGCGALTGWGWQLDAFNWGKASFNLPFTIKEGCVERAIKSAGGPGGLKCTGHGLKKRSKMRNGKRSLLGRDSPTRTIQQDRRFRTDQDRFDLSEGLEGLKRIAPRAKLRELLADVTNLLLFRYSTQE